MTMAQRHRTIIAVAKETAIWGTGTNPTALIPVNSVSPSLQYDLILDQGHRGVGARDFRSQQGAGHSELTIEGMAHPEEIGMLLARVMGADAITGVGPYTHVLTMDNAPGSLTVEDDIIAGASGGNRYTGCRVGQIAFQFNAGEGALMYSAQLMGKIPTKVTATNPAAAEANPWEAWRMVVASTGYVTRVISGELTIGRELQVVHTGQNTQDASYIVPGPLYAEGSLVLAAEDMTDFDNFKAHLTQPFQVQMTYGAGASAKTITFLMTSCNFGNGPLEVDRGNIGVMFNLQLLGLYNATDAGPIKVTIINSRATAY